MVVNKTIRAVLSQRIGFSPLQISQLEQNADLLSRLIGYLRILKHPATNRETRQLAIRQVKKIKQTMNDAETSTNNLLLQARSEYYSFQRPVR